VRRTGTFQRDIPQKFTTREDKKESLLTNGHNGLPENRNLKNLRRLHVGKSFHDDKKQIPVEMNTGAPGSVLRCKPEVWEQRDRDKKTSF